jgi:trigger factor
LWRTTENLRRGTPSVTKTKTKILKSHEAQLTVEIEEEQLRRAMDAAVKRLSKRIRVPGFRPGKAPLHVIASQVGMEAVQEEAVEILAEEVYPSALKESGVSPFGPGELIDISQDQTVLTFKVPLQPEIDLGNYRALRVPYKEPDISDEVVERTLSGMREDQAILEPVERPAEMGDALTITLKGQIEGDEEFSLDESDLHVVIGGEIEEGLPGISEHLVGLTVGEARAFDLRMPKKKQFKEEIRGKNLHIELTCSEVFDRELPELDDEFARSVGDNASLEDLRTKIREVTRQSAESLARRDYVDAVIDALTERAKIQYPPVVVEEEIDEMMKDFDRNLREQRLALREYMQINNLTEEDLRKDFRPTAEERLRTGFVMTEFIRQEGLTVSDEEIEDEIKTMSLSYGTEAQAAQKTLSGKKGRQTVLKRLLLDKAIDRLLAIAKGEKVPPPTLLADAEEK